MLALVAVMPVAAVHAQPSYMLTTLASFDGTDGDAANGVVLNSAGNLYGTTAMGGANFNYGAVFEVAAGSGTITNLAIFNFADGRFPDGPLILDGDGNLYGTTILGGTYDSGTVFEIANGSDTITTLADFNTHLPDGSEPEGALVRDSSGNLYGTASITTSLDNSVHNDGLVYEVAAGSGAITDLATFNGANGSSPAAGLVMDAAGDFYGTTQAGGASNDGVVFKVAAGSGTITDLASFDGANGLDPASALVRDGSGNLYGTTVQGGANDDGTLFEIPAGTSAIDVLASFAGIDGLGSSGGLTMGPDGNLYGTTVQGGAHGRGDVFEVASGTNKITDLFDFTSDGGGGLVVRNASGDLFGSGGAGAHGDGAIFELTPGSTSAPEPGTLPLLIAAAGAFAVAGLRRRSAL